jgi:V8-like Glu-specific endopeptidase
VTHRSIGAITFLTKKKRFAVGSGILISKNIVLTAAHNIYDKDYNCENSDFRFYVGANGETNIFYTAESWKYP